MITVGSDLIVNGRWAQVEQIFHPITGEDCTFADHDNPSMFVVDQEGESFEIDASMIDHVY